MVNMEVTYATVYHKSNNGQIIITCSILLLLEDVALDADLMPGLVYAGLEL